MPKKSKKIMTGAEALIKCLENQGVEYIFGYPGGAVIPIFDALVNCLARQVHMTGKPLDGTHKNSGNRWSPQRAGGTEWPRQGHALSLGV